MVNDVKFHVSISCRQQEPVFPSDCLSLKKFIARMIDQHFSLTMPTIDKSTVKGMTRTAEGL